MQLASFRIVNGGRKTIGAFVSHCYIDLHALTGGQLPADMQSGAFHDWRREFLRGHKPQTRLTGSWNYAEKVRQAQ